MAKHVRFRPEQWNCATRIFTGDFAGAVQALSDMSVALGHGEITDHKVAGALETHVASRQYRSDSTEGIVVRSGDSRISFRMLFHDDGSGMTMRQQVEGASEEDSNTYSMAGFCSWDITPDMLLANDVNPIQANQKIQKRRRRESARAHLRRTAREMKLKLFLTIPRRNVRLSLLILLVLMMGAIGYTSVPIVVGIVVLVRLLWKRRHRFLRRISVRRKRR